MPRRNRRKQAEYKRLKPLSLTPRPRKRGSGKGRNAHLRWRSCERKKKRTRADAEQHARQLHRKDGADMLAYKCQYEDCVLPDGSRSWHVGHRQPQLRIGTRREYPSKKRGDKPRKAA